MAFIRLCWIFNFCFIFIYFFDIFEPCDLFIVCLFLIFERIQSVLLIISAKYTYYLIQVIRIIKSIYAYSFEQKIIKTLEELF